MLWWIIASGVGGLLIIGYLLAGITGPITWDEIRYWYVPVTAIVAVLTTRAQALALLRLVSRFTFLFYIPITTIGWVVGWNVGLLMSSEQVSSAQVISGNDISQVLWFTFPFLCIGIFSGLVLAPQLRARCYVPPNLH